ncbi:tRNA pseudouridine synthase A [Actinomyces gaoshouyii]|uniref:tRNA pseudouridine synthase A n=1 Tax=Actinomyces gaoshouyii TaxID=1960083 RepID=A0A8H9HD57_9ACTO|nr:tRNA pseudouridine synthase A [Actinomyces gaoshouyii]GGO96483.1 tRNA pseudouridine synthase A [Actinomyces gaoshouyii]
MEDSKEPNGDDPLVRVRLDLAYDGAGFAGWAAQPGLRTVEGVITEALGTVLRVPVRLTVAGRTDAGVHAAAQVAHFDVAQEAWRSLPGRSDRAPGQALLTRLAGVLAREARESAASGGAGTAPRGTSDVVVNGAREAPEGFDARFSATERAYRYRIADGGPAAGSRDPGRRGSVLWIPEALDVGAMRRAAAPLLGEHDFLGYCKPREGATTIRTLKRLEWSRVPGGATGREGADEGLVVLDVVADAFCHSMVRSLVGACLAVGQGRRDEDWPARILLSASRDAAAPVAPAHGLTLERVSYPADDELADRAERARALRTLPAPCAETGRYHDRDRSR